MIDWIIDRWPVALLAFLLVLRFMGRLQGVGFGRQPGVCGSCGGTGTSATGSAAIGSAGEKNRALRPCWRCGGRGVR